MSDAYHGTSGLLIVAIWDMSDSGDHYKESHENAVSEQPKLSANAVSFTE